MAMIITPDVGRSMMEAIAAGRAKYVEQRYKQALASFTEVSRSRSPWAPHASHLC
jgi:hypothetical protein